MTSKKLVIPPQAESAPPRRKASALVYYFFRKKLPPDLFRILRSRRVLHEGVRADLFVIDGSHVLSFEAFGKNFTEVVTSSNHPFPNDGAVETSGLYAKNLAFASKEERFKYSVTSRKLVIADDADYEQKHLEIAETHSNGLIHVFKVEEDSRLSPFTAMEAVKGQKSLTVESTHAFPAEKTMIYTQSRIEIEGA